MNCRRCGHAARTHEHYRPGSDCAICACHRYGGPWPWQRRAARAEAALDAARDAVTAARSRAADADEQLAAAVTAYNQALSHAARA